MKTISIPEELHKQIVILKMQEKAKNAAELIKKLIIEYKKQKLNEFRDDFRKALKDKGITFDEFMKRAKKIRGEMYDEQSG